MPSSCAAVQQVRMLSDLAVVIEWKMSIPA
jgi:hypothetical protein